MGAGLSGEEYLSSWSALHGGVEPAGMVGWWLSVTFRLARPLVRLRVAPDVLTLIGLCAAVAAVGAASAVKWWLLLAFALVIVSGVFDSLDGAVAVMSGRATRRGFVLDSVCDRLADAAYVAVLWRLGAPGSLVVVGGSLAWLHEYVRARAAVAGMPEIGVVTVSERPTRVIVTAMTVLSAGVFPASALWWARLGAGAWTALSVIGLIQLVVVVRRRLP